LVTDEVGTWYLVAELSNRWAAFTLGFAMHSSYL